MTDHINIDPRILVAGIGNIFHGDDGFGVEVVQQLGRHRWAENVRVVDFGVSGLDLACALMDDYQAVILVDATKRGQEPGTLYVIEPHIHGCDAEEPQRLMIETHAMGPEQALAWAKAMGARVPFVRLIGCEPARIGSDDELLIGLSDPVRKAIDEAVALVQQLVDDIQRGELIRVT